MAWNRSTEVQSLIFDREYFTLAKAKSWAKRNNFRYGRPDQKENTIRIRQQDPKLFRPSTFRTISLTDGVKATIAVPRRSAR